MNGLTLTVNTLTNVFAFYPINVALRKSNYIAAGLTCSSMLASILMHATETKHELIPPIGGQYSKYFLNIDRLMALILVSYAVYHASKIPPPLLILPGLKLITGAICLRLGEITPNLHLYTLLHTIWHYCAYTSLGDVMMMINC